MSRDSNYLTICIIALTVALSASVLAIYLGIRVGANNGHSLIVLFMNIMQIVYSISVYFVDTSVLKFQYDQFIVNEAVSMYAGIVSTLLSNVLAFAAVYILYLRKTIPLVQNFHYIMFWCSFPGIVICIAYICVSYPEDQTDSNAQDTILLGAYYYLRIASIALNFIFSAMTLYKIHSMSSNRYLRQQSRHQPPRKPSLYEVALRTLAKRMVLYPIVQALGRSGFAWYEGEFGNNIFSLDTVSAGQYRAMVFCVLVTPMISVGYLVIFLFMQPEARVHLWSLVLCQWTLPTIVLGKATETSKEEVSPEDWLASQAVASHPSHNAATRSQLSGATRWSKHDDDEVLETDDDGEYSQTNSQYAPPGQEISYSHTLPTPTQLNYHEHYEYDSDNALDDDDLYEIISEAASQHSPKYLVSPVHNTAALLLHQHHHQPPPIQYQQQLRTGAYIQGTNSNSSNEANEIPKSSNSSPLTNHHHHGTSSTSSSLATEGVVHHGTHGNDPTTSIDP